MPNQPQSQPQSPETHLRGARMGSKAAVVEEMEELRPKGDPGLYWGGLHLPSEDGPRHFCVMGATGSGKTVLLRLLMQSVLPLVASGASHLGLKRPQKRAEKIAPASRPKKPEKPARPRFETKDLTAYQQLLKIVATLLMFLAIFYNGYLVNVSWQGDEITDLSCYGPAIVFPFFWFATRTSTFGFSALFALVSLVPASVITTYSVDPPSHAVLRYLSIFFLGSYLVWIAIHDWVKAIGAIILSFVLLAIPEIVRNAQPDLLKYLQAADKTGVGLFIGGLLVGTCLFYRLGFDRLRRFGVSPVRQVVSSIANGSGANGSGPPPPQDNTAAESTRPAKYRALVYDAKQDAASLVRAINPRCRVVILNPFDTRCAAWDMARDITKPSTADQVATILIPDNKSASQPFFANAARQLLGGVFKALILLKPRAWDFRDVVLATKSKERLIGLLEKTPHTQDLVGQYFGNPAVVDSILAELATYMGPYEHIAATWSIATEKVSLTHWIKNEYILLLGNDESHRTALDAVNRLIFQRLTEIVLARPETDNEQTWIFLDEVREAGELEGLSRLLNKGRSKGACVVLGFQDIDGMRSVYGDKIANEIVGQCNHMAMLRLNSPETAQWASERIGECETIDEESSFTEGEGTSTQESANKGVSRSPGLIFKPATSLDSGESTSSSTESSRSETRNQKKVIKAAVLASEFLHLPLTNRSNGLTGYFIVPQVRAGAYRCEIPGEEIFPRDPSKTVLVAPDPNFPNFLERPPADEYLLPLTKEESAHFGMTPKTPAETPAEEKKAETPPDKTDAPPSPKTAPPRNIREKAPPAPQTDSPPSPTAQKSGIKKSGASIATEDEVKRLREILDRGKP